MPQSCEITTITVAGREIAATQVICPKCGTLDLGTTFDTSGAVWKATCPNGHTWPIEVKAN